MASDLADVTFPVCCTGKRFCVQQDAANLSFVPLAFSRQSQTSSELRELFSLRTFLARNIDICQLVKLRNKMKRTKTRCRCVCG